MGKEMNYYFIPYSCWDQNRLPWKTLNVKLLQNWALKSRNGIWNDKDYYFTIELNVIKACYTSMQLNQIKNRFSFYIKDLRQQIQKGTASLNYGFSS